MIKTYFRQILKTGLIEELPFDKSHAEEAMRCGIKGAVAIEENLGIARSMGLELVNKWNKSTFYKYWI